MKCLWLVTIVVCILSFSAEAKLLPDEQNNVEIYQRCNPAVVNITATMLTQDFFFDVIPQKGLGSGAIIKPEGYIVTNHHVVGDAVEVEVTLSDKSQYKAKVVGTDPDSDLAVIKINPKGKKLPFVQYEDPGTLAVGQKTLAIGNPFGLGGSLSVGIISSLGRDIRSPSHHLVKDVIQTDAAINPGNSGGPLLNSSGKLIGINAQILSESGGNQGIGFAISVKTMKHIVEQLIQFGEVMRPDLGVEGVEMSAGLLQVLNVPIDHGVMILALRPRGAAAKAGLRPANRQVRIGFRIFPYGGDVIYQIDDTPIVKYQDIVDYISDLKEGTKVTVHFMRNGARKTVGITLKLSSPNQNPGESL